MEDKEEKLIDVVSQLFSGPKKWAIEYSMGAPLPLPIWEMGEVTSSELDYVCYALVMLNKLARKECGKSAEFVRAMNLMYWGYEPRFRWVKFDNYIDWFVKWNYAQARLHADSRKVLV